ncbi:hypothetical protein FD754_023514, partial [Muntiacus muntjak]
WFPTSEKPWIVSASGSAGGSLTFWRKLAHPVCGQTHIVQVGQPKNICICFIDYTKAFDCVDNNKRWKILHEMGILDHLTCLLRNLYEVYFCGIRFMSRVDTKRPFRNHLSWHLEGTPVLEKVLGYNIWYFPENNTNLTETMNTTNQQPELYLGNQTYWVHVISYNSLGKSPEATLRIPAIDEKLFQCIEAMHTCLTQDQLVSVSHTRNWIIQQDKLKPFWCYNISVYPMLQNRVGEPYSIQAYVKEGVPSAGPVMKVENIGVRTVTITWKEIPKHQRNGFINNYTIFYQVEDGKGFSKTVNSSILRYDLESLTRKTSYTVRVMASTSAGGANGPGINFKTSSITCVPTQKTHSFLLTETLSLGTSFLILTLPHLSLPDLTSHHFPIMFAFMLLHLLFFLSSLSVSSGEHWQQQRVSRWPASLLGRVGSRVPMELELWSAHAQDRLVLANYTVLEDWLKAICPACSGHCREGSLSSGSCPLSPQGASFYPECHGLPPW